MTREMLRSTAVAHAMVLLIADVGSLRDPHVAIGFDALMDELSDEVAKASQAETAVQEETIQTMRDRAADTLRATDDEARGIAAKGLLDAFSTFSNTVPGYGS